MKHVLLDTHAWVWSFAEVEQLSESAKEVIAAADAVFVSPISFFEIGQKVRLGKWPEMEPMVEKLPAVLKEQGGLPAAFTSEICLHASLRVWAHRDPFDRLLASTAELSDMKLISKDEAFDAVGEIHRVW